MRDALRPVAFADLPGWPGPDIATAFEAFRRQAVEILERGSGFRRIAAFGGERQDWMSLCQAAEDTPDPQVFFQTHFKPYQVEDQSQPEGLFTGYYEPLLQGSLTPSPDYPVPVYAKPQDLVAFTAQESQAAGVSYGRRCGSRAIPYATRKEIEQGCLQDKTEILCWVRDWVDAFFMHVQGQGRVDLSDGRSIRLSYAGKNGHPYTGIGHVLIERGVAPSHQMSMQVLRDWMHHNPEQARALMWHNASYIFFQIATVTDATLGGLGAAKVNLTPGHSLAIDRAWWMFGTPLWLDTTLPPEIARADTSIRRLMIAQDTGSAIKGRLRGDVFWGWGDDATAIAGHMKSQGRMTALLPLRVAERLGLSS
jgi:membrane-bound lytic murein transglycosylase A